MPQRWRRKSDSSSERGLRFRRRFKSPDRKIDTWKEEKIPEPECLTAQSDQLAREYREEGNVFYRRALLGAKRDPPLPAEEQTQLLADARTLYERSIQSAESNPEQARAQKNIGQTYLQLVKISHDAVSICRSHLQARMAFVDALQLAQSGPKQGNFERRWFDQLQSRLNITNTHLDDVMPLMLEKEYLVNLLDTPDDRLEFLLLAMGGLSEDAPFFWQTHATLAQEYLDAALLNAHNDNGLGNIEERLVLGQLKLLDMGLEHVANAMRLSSVLSSHETLATLDGQLRFHRALSEMNFQLDSADARFEATRHAAGESSVDDRDTVRAELLEIRNIYQLLLFEVEHHNFLEHEALILSRLGRICDAMGRRITALREYSKCVELAGALEKDVTNLAWYNEASTWIQTHQARIEAAQNAQNARVYSSAEAQRHVNRLKKLEDNKVVSPFIDYLWEHIPPKNQKPKPNFAVIVQNGGQEDLLDDIYEWYTPERVGSKEWKDICLAVRNSVNRYVNFQSSGEIKWMGEGAAAAKSPPNAAKKATATEGGM